MKLCITYQHPSCHFRVANQGSGLGLGNCATILGNPKSLGKGASHFRDRHFVFFSSLPNGKLTNLASRLSSRGLVSRAGLGFFFFSFAPFLLFFFLSSYRACCCSRTNTQTPPFPIIPFGYPVVDIPHLTSNSLLLSSSPTSPPSNINIASKEQSHPERHHHGRHAHC